MRENRSLEYKETINTNTFLKTVSAYANYGGGDIIFGVTDAGEIHGIPDPEAACLSLETKINDSICPVPEYFLEIREDHTIRLTVQEGIYKPYVYRGKAYKRNDSATIETDRLEYNRLVLEGRNQSFEELPSKRQDLSFSCLEAELVRHLGIRQLNQDILKTLELYSDHAGFNQAAALLADANPFKGIEIVRFGETINEIMDRLTLEGCSILEQFHRSLQMFRKYYQYEKIEGSERISAEKIPEEAFRETVANALVHRTWDVNAFIRISMFTDRIEVSSPGGLPAGISEEEYLNGQISILRNPIIGNVFFRLKYIEKFGTGILRIKNEYAAMLEKPVFRIFPNSLLVILPAASGEQLTAPEKKIVNLLREQGSMTRAQIEAFTGTGKDTTVRTLNGLLKKNIIERTGAGRGTRYRMIL